jgi:acylphosphatase
MKTYHYLVKGIVQGVFFRYHTKEAAQKLNITGTVQNLYNGDVEVYCQGQPADIQAFENFLREGPPAATVNELIKEESDSSQQYRTFDVLY